MLSIPKGRVMLSSEEQFSKALSPTDSIPSCKEMLFKEGNQRLKHRTFGATADSEGKSYAAATTNISRYKNAAKRAKSGSPEEKQKALRTMQKMQNNWSGLAVATNQYETAKAVDKQINPGLKSAPKNSGNGKAHSKKTPDSGVFLNE